MPRFQPYTAFADPGIVGIVADSHQGTVHSTTRFAYDTEYEAMEVAVVICKNLNIDELQNGVY